MASKTSRVSPSVSARLGFESASMAITGRPLRPTSLANVPDVVVFPDPPLPEIPTFIRRVYALYVRNTLSGSGRAQPGLPPTPLGICSSGSHPGHRSVDLVSVEDVGHHSDLFFPHIVRYLTLHCVV